MAWTQERAGRFRVLFRFQGKQHAFNLERFTLGWTTCGGFRLRRGDQEERGQREEGRGQKTGTIRPRGPCWPALRPFSLWLSFSGFFPLASVLFPFPFVLICPRNRVCVQSVSEALSVKSLPTRPQRRPPTSTTC